MVARNIIEFTITGFEKTANTSLNFNNSFITHLFRTHRNCTEYYCEAVINQYKFYIYLLNT